AAFSSLRIWLLMGKCSLVPQFLLLLSCEDQSRIKFDGSGTFHFRVAWCCGLEVLSLLQILVFFTNFYSQSYP
ncbi:hypothetical protein CMV_019863, partial [Castanea mollissima]